MKLTATSYAILGQLALRRQTTYELVNEMRRNVHFFWPHAERGVYAEAKRLAAAGLVLAERDHVGRRPRTSYSITPSGQRALEEWLGTPVRPFSLEFEGLLRVFLGDLGATDDMVEALRRTESDAVVIIRLGQSIIEEYHAGRAPFQEQLHVRAFVIDFLISFAALTRDWARRTGDEVEAQRALTPEQRRQRGFGIVARHRAPNHP